MSGNNTPTRAHPESCRSRVCGGAARKSRPTAPAHPESTAFWVRPYSCKEQRPFVITLRQEHASHLFRASLMTGEQRQQPLGVLMFRLSCHLQPFCNVLQGAGGSHQGIHRVQPCQHRTLWVINSRRNLLSAHLLAHCFHFTHSSCSFLHAHPVSSLEHKKMPIRRF